MTLLGQDYLHNRKVNNAAANQASSQTANRPTTQTTKVTNALDPPVKQTSLYDRDSYYQTLFDIYAELDTGRQH